MRFRQFWPLYLRAHSLPGTRAMHYVATAIGVMATIEAVVAQEPWICIGGIALAYALAILGHWAIERNQPLIGIAPIWGAVADLRMVWLALTGRLEREFEKRGLPVAVEPASGFQTVLALYEFDMAARSALKHYDTRFHRYVLLVVSAAGLAFVLADLHDLVEPMGKPAYPIVQLGVPIVAFGAAALLSYYAMQIGRSQLHTVLNWFEALERKAIDSAAGKEIDHLKQSLESLMATETSLRRASIAQVILGVMVFAAAELAEMVMAVPARGLTLL